MRDFLLTLHIAAAALTAGALFLQSLAVVMALRLAKPEWREGARILQQRLHRFIYYPILVVTLLGGLWLALATGAFGEGKWLHWKLVLVVLLVGLGLLVGKELRGGKVIKPVAMVVHIVIFLVILAIVYLAAVKPF